MQDKCRRTVCNNMHDNYRHSMSGEMYCKSCALKINRANNLPSLIVKVDDEQNTPPQTAVRK